MERHGLSTGAQGKLLSTGVLLFIYGSLVHFILLNAYVHWWSGAPKDPRAGDHPATVVTIVLLGGTVVTWFFLGLLRRMLEVEKPQLFSFFWRGCVYGAVSTFTALEIFYVSAAAFHALLGQRHASVLARLNSFVEFLIGIQTFGLDPIRFSIPFDLLYGGLAVFGLLKARKYLPRWPAAQSSVWRAGRTSLVLGVLGLPFFWLPIPGGMLQLLAIGFGLYARKEGWDADRAGRRMARVGILLGIVGLVSLVATLTLGFVLYTQPPGGLR